MSTGNLLPKDDPGIDTYDQPLLDAWWTRGFTAQNTAYIPAPQSIFGNTQFPPTVAWVNVERGYTDFDSDPLGGYLTFWPSESCTLTVTGYKPLRLLQRYSGSTTPQALLPTGAGILYSQKGSGKIYLDAGLMAVTLLATDNPGLVTDSGNPLTYLVTEHFEGGTQFQISVPSASADPVELYDLMIAGTQIAWKYDPLFPQGTQLPAVPTGAEASTSALSSLSQSVLSTQYYTVNVSDLIADLPANPTTNLVYMAFMTSGNPTTNDWQQASWVTVNSAPYEAQFLVGPNGYPLATGTYTVWFRMDDLPLQPVVKAGTLVIY